MQSVLDALEGQPFSVTGVKKSEKKRTPAPPFITSTLQQEASRKLNMTPRRTMMIAQQLYEGVEISGEGSVGLITYMRTDSLRISEEALAAAGKTPLYFAEEQQLLGVVAVADVVKPDSAAAIAALRRSGREVVLLTGDDRRTAEAIARQVGVERVIAQVLPQDKARCVEELQKGGKLVAMVGDGVNDAPALVTADVGLAIGAGTDVAIESADVVLMHSSLMDIVDAAALSRATLRNIRQNLFWAFFYNAIGIPVAAGVLYPALQLTLDPMLAAAAMSLSSVCVVSNALRLRSWKGAPTDNHVSLDKSADLTDNDTVHTDHTNTAASAAQQEEPTMQKTLTIEGMMCAHCAAHVEKALNALPGVTAVVDLAATTRP